MNFRAGLSASFAIAVAGCVAASKPPPAGPDAAFSATVASASPTPRAATPAPQRPAVSQAIKLEAFEVKESAFCDFGMSVKTNVEVQWNGGIEWMQVSGLAPASSAARAGLVVGDRILAIDSRSISAMTRGEMLEALFGRKKGESSRLLVLGLGDALPRFVQLVANPSAHDRRS